MRGLFLAFLVAATVTVSACDNGGDGWPLCGDGSVCGDGKCAFSEWGVCTEDCTICGDGYCDEGTETESCPMDCSFCGDDVCTEYEFSYGCVRDCFPCINLLWRVVVNCIPENCGYYEDVDVVCSICGDGICEPREDRYGCPDCVEDTCGDGECLDWERGSCEDCADEVCGDGFCGHWEEAFVLCPQDCDECGDGVCDTSELDFCNVDCRPLDG